MTIRQCLSRGRRRLLVMTGGTLLAAAAAILPTAGVANASATTCLQVSAGAICTYVNGSGGYVNHVDAGRDKTGQICGESAWFYYVPPTGGAHGLAALTHNGCTDIHSDVTLHLNRTFPHRTLICVKYYDNYWGDYLGTDCVGLS